MGGRVLTVLLSFSLPPHSEKYAEHQRLDSNRDFHSKKGMYRCMIATLGLNTNLSYASDSGPDIHMFDGLDISRRLDGLMIAEDLLYIPITRKNQRSENI